MHITRFVQKRMDFTRGYQRMRRQQRGRRIMILAGIIGRWKVPDGGEIIADLYIIILRELLERWLKKATIIFMQDDNSICNPLILQILHIS